MDGWIAVMLITIIGWFGFCWAINGREHDGNCKGH